MSRYVTWATATLGELLNLVIDYRGKTPKKLGGVWQDSGIPAVSAKNVKNNRFVRDDTIKYVSSELYAKWMKDELEAGDILLTSEAPLGQLLFLKQKMKLVLSQRLFALRVNQKKIVPQFLCYYLESEMGQAELYCRATGATAQGIRQSLLMDVKVTFPPLAAQQKIAAMLSSYDDLIENNLRRIQILEVLAQNIYREWFVKFHFPSHEHISFVDSPLGSIPEGWQVEKLGDCCELIMGQSPKSEFYNDKGEGLPFHQGVTDFGDRFPTVRIYCTITERIAEEGDVLFSVRAPVGRINVALHKLVIGRGIAAIRARDRHQSFLFHQLKEIFCEEDSMGSGTIFKAVTKSDLMGLKLIKPSSSILLEFDRISYSIGLQIKALTAKNITLHNTRNLLLPKLISGEVDVSELNITLPKEENA